MATMPSRSTSRRLARSGSIGPAVDRSGAPVIDPTENVLALVSAAVDRLNDLSAASAKLFEQKERRLDDMLTVKTAHIDEVARLRAEHNEQINKLRGEFEEKLREKETQRIDAIRAVDVGAVGRASEVSAAQAITLATQVATSAETLRTQVAASAAAAATALVQALEPIQTAIGELRKTQYEQQGQAAQRVEARGDQRAGTQNNQWIIGAIFSGVAVLISLAGLVVVLVKVG